jgi:hypothetical protein
MSDTLNQSKKNINHYNIMTHSRVNKYSKKSLNDYSLLKKIVWEKVHQLTPEDKQQFINNLQKELEQQTALEQWKKQSISSKNINTNKQKKRKLTRKYKYDENPEQETSRVERNKMFMLDNDDKFIKYESNYKNTVESYKLRKLYIPSDLGVEESGRSPS